MTTAAALGSDQRFYDGKAEVYLDATNEVLRQTVIGALPPGGRVLDVGCGSGALLRDLEGRAAYRAGVEISSVAAQSAARVADDVVTAPVMRDLPFAPESFDVVVCADVLEHLDDPLGALSWAAGWCRPGGAVVISVPNVANWQARLRLLRGRWEYEPCGLFDSGHLRFFTRASLLQLLSDAGLEVESCEPARVPSMALQVPSVVGWPRLLRAPINRIWLIVGYRLARARPELFAYQFVCVARRPARRSDHHGRGKDTTGER
jgi:SAM-dependent methyltransferase